MLPFAGQSTDLIHALLDGIAVSVDQLNFAES